MAEDFLLKARRYIEAHNSFSEVSEIVDLNGIWQISAIASVSLPAKFKKRGQTDQGVRDKEPVQFLFGPQFPLVAPNIRLRPDFPRCFPHINPSESDVVPCIYAGSLSELLQQQAWMDEILNQLSDWLHKAAANDLMNTMQGWEPMRSDHCGGYFIYDDAFLEEKSSGVGKPGFVETISITQEQGLYIVGKNIQSDGVRKVQHVYSSTTKPFSTYLPNFVGTLRDLYTFANMLAIGDLRSHVQQADSSGRNEREIIVTLGILRPFRLKDSSSSVEFVSYLLEKKQNKSKKFSISDDVKLTYLAHVSDRSPSLLRKLSGTRSIYDKDRKIAIVGCGSIGSKLALHMARNGNGPFLLIDNDFFWPHNNARHALFSAATVPKNMSLCFSIQRINGKLWSEMGSDAISTDYSGVSLIVESTASMAVRSHFMRIMDRPGLVSAALFDHGRKGLLILEGKHKKTLLCDAWAFLYMLSRHNMDLRDTLFVDQTEEVVISQSCRSSTLVTSDALISLYAASFGLRIQEALENGLPKNGEILLASRESPFGLGIKKIEVPEFVDVLDKKGDPYSVRIPKEIVEKMKSLSEQKTPNETGGVLLGTIFQNANRIVITEILDGPPDSVESPNEFILGTKGLRQSILTIEEESHDRVTYLGTWHSHTRKGAASGTDSLTLKKLDFVRNHEPTICLIYTPDGLIRV